MISISTFLQAVKSATKREPNTGQGAAVGAAKDAALFVVAGPGTGKTATLTLRMLKLIFVDGLPPRSILATTFTKKAAAELRSRLLSWGYALQEHLLNKETLTPAQRTFVDKVDINQVRTGTIDSLCEELLRDFRDPGMDPPILADDFVSKTLLLRFGMFGGKRYDDDDLDEFLVTARGTGKFGWHLGAKTDLLRTLWDRRHHDQLNWSGFSQAGSTPEEKQARKLLDDALVEYSQELGKRLMVDFAQLEQTVLDRLRAGGMKEFTDELRAVLVDEYQDSNLLQESLYFELAKRCGGALTVVGDDDQSLYRFRGATVDLFRDFETRYQAIGGFKQKPLKVFLNENYRSSKTIIDFVNAYATLDQGYQAVRVKGKPPLTNPQTRQEFPVLGLFRHTPEDLAKDLAKFIHDVTKGKGRMVGTTLIKIDATKGGNVGDCAFLCSSPQEYGGDGSRERLPMLLKQEFATLKPVIEVFNPRGQDFASLPVVQVLGGLLLMCLDFSGAVQMNCKGINDDIRATFDNWRSAADAWVNGPPKNKDVEAYVVAWADREPGKKGFAWPKSVSCIDLLYGLVHWLPELHDDAEGQVYLEVFTRQLTAAEQVSNFKTRVVTDPAKPELSAKSIDHLLQYFLGPIASGAVTVDEALIEAFPRDRLSVLSIHQSKGLEFPLVVVDVGSDFKINSASQAFKRFPRSLGPPHNLEDLMRPHSPLAMPTRAGMDRAFDDLFRQYFVAFSRPQDVLLLTGLTTNLPGKKVQNVATGYDRTGTNHWAGKLPFVEI